MADRFQDPPPGRLRRLSQISVDALGIWSETPPLASGSFSSEHARQHSEMASYEEGEVYQQQEMEMAPLPFDEMWGFPSHTPLRVSQPRELARLRFPNNDVPVQALERMKNRQGRYKMYVNYPGRLFHLRPQSKLKIPEDLDWESAFLWQKVPRSQCKAAWIEYFPCPALDMPLPYFPKELLTYGLTLRVSQLSIDEALEFAAAVFNSTARPLSEARQDWYVQWRDIRSRAKSIVRQLEKQGSRRATDMAVRMRRQQKVMREYESFFRFRDSDRKPTGMGFRGSRDMFFLDDEFVTDFINRAIQNWTPSVRMRSEAKLISFLDSLDAAKVTILMVSAQAFREPWKSTYLCYAIARTFPNLEELRLISIGIVGSDSDTTARWNITPEFWFRTGNIQRLVESEIRSNGGSSYLRMPHEDDFPRFHTYEMSAALMEATGAYEDGHGRLLAGEPPRTPLVAYAIRAGLIHDPDPDQQPPDDQRGQDPPFIAAVQHLLTAAFKVIVRRREVAAEATTAEALANLEGRWTLLPRPVARGPAWGVWSAERRYRPSETRPEDFRWLAQDHIAREQRGHAHAYPESTEPESAHSAPAAETGPYARKYARVESSVLVYEQDAYDKNVSNGWTGFGPGVDMSFFP